MIQEMLLNGLLQQLGRLLILRMMMRWDDQRVLVDKLQKFA